MARQSLGQFLFSSKGRVSRMEYNVYFLLPFMAVNWLLAELPKWFQGNLEMLFTVSLITTLLSLVILWPFIAMTNKRFHDRNTSGWRQLTYVLISVFGIIIAMKGVQFDMNPTAMTFAYNISNPMLGYIGVAVFFLPMIAMIIDLCVLKGTDGPNKYGDDPLQEISKEG